MQFGYLDKLPWFHKVWSVPLFWLLVLMTTPIGFLLVLPLNLLSGSLKIQYMEEKTASIFYFLIFGVFYRLEEWLRKWYK